MANENILKVKNLQKAYGRHEILRDISFSVKRGELMGLLGKNGSGKTTLMKYDLSDWRRTQRSG